MCKANSQKRRTTRAAHLFPWRKEPNVKAQQVGYTRRFLLKSLAAGSSLCVLGDLGAGAANAAVVGGRKRLPRAAPESVGVDPAAIAAFLDGVEENVGGLHSLMLLRHGKVAAEGWWAPYAPRHPHMLYSLSKSFTSTALGLAVSEGKLTVDDRVISFFPELLPASISPNLKAMRVRHLLSMSTGHDKDATGPSRQAGDGNWARAFLALPVEHQPGSKFVYNSAATYMLSAIVQKLSGNTVLEYLTPRLFEPLGIEGPTWESCPRGINTGGWGLNVKTEDIARFGQLYLQKGKWGDRQLVAETWVNEATSKHVSNGDNPASDWAQGYGYQFWRCRHGGYRGDGAFGQYCVVLPEQDAVLAITSGIGNMQSVLNVAWERLLPGMKSSVSGGSASASLSQRLGALAIKAPEGSPTSLTAARVSGKLFRMDRNPEQVTTAETTFRNGGCVLTLAATGGDRHIECGGVEWIKGTTPLGDTLAAYANARYAARGAWTTDDTYAIRLCFYETPYIQTLTLKFAGDQLTITSKMNVGFGPTERQPLVGKLA